MGVKLKPRDPHEQHSDFIGQPYHKIGAVLICTVILKTNLTKLISSFLLNGTILYAK